MSDKTNIPPDRATHSLRSKGKCFPCLPLKSMGDGNVKVLIFENGLPDRVRYLPWHRLERQQPSGMTLNDLDPQAWRRTTASNTIAHLNRPPIGMQISIDDHGNGNAEAVVMGCRLNGFFGRIKTLYGDMADVVMQAENLKYCCA